MSVFKRPLIALSLTEPDVGLIRYAARAVDPSHVEQIRFAHVVSDEGRKPTAAELEGVRERMIAEVRSHFAGVGTTPAFDVVWGPSLDQLLALSALHHADVVMLGHRRGRSGHRSLARRLAMVGNASVWLVPEGSPERLSRAIVPVDFSAHSADALSLAARLCSVHGISRCLALHVYFDPSSVRYREQVAEILGREREHFDEFKRRIDDHGVKLELALEESTHPAEAILRVAEREQSDLIVMNTRGRSTAAAIMLGSITSKVMEETTIPVLAVKHFGDRMSLLQAVLNHRTWEGGSFKTN